FVLTFSLFGQTISFPRQGLAVLALIPIWLYRGEQGRKTRWFQYFCYAFYPVHMLIVAVLAGNASPGLLPVLFVPAACVLLWRVM
uniref:TraX family protein n=1 Tax=Klebsiella pneumoniae TaxID=573 RepID=UPI0025A05928